jgi:hypothetical protein
MDEGSVRPKACFPEKTIEDMVVDGARNPWIWLREDLRRLGIPPDQIRDYRTMTQDPRIRRLIDARRHTGNFYARQRRQELELGIITPEAVRWLKGFLEYGLQVRPEKVLGGLKNELFAYMCGQCEALVLGAPAIQTVSGRNSVPEALLNGRPQYVGIQGVLYSCTRCEKDMLIEALPVTECVD